MIWMRSIETVAFLLIFSVSLASMLFYVKLTLSDPGILRVPADYLTIQSAVDAASAGDMILVSAGIYYEHVVISKSNLSLIGEGSEATIIDGENQGENVLRITGKNVRITGFTFRNGYNGIQLSSADGCVLSNNLIINNSAGIWIIDSYNVTLKNNTMKDNLGNLGIETIHREEILSFIHNIDTSNTVNGKKVYYLLNQKDLLINSLTFPDLGYLALVNSKNITVKDLTVKNVDAGVLLANTSYSSIINLTSSNNCIGVYLWGSKNNLITQNYLTFNGGGILIEQDSSNNTIYGNWILNNDVAGIEILYSSNNTIINNFLISNKYRGITFYFGFEAGGNLFVNNTVAGSRYGVVAGGDGNLLYHNNFFDNDVQVDWGHPNVWDNGFEGNYWGDYNGTDSDGDGVGDTPYVINAENQDNYPLMHEHPPLYCDLNTDGVVDIYDLIIIAAAFGTQPPDPNWNPNADTNKDRVVDLYDLITTAKRFGTQAHRSK